MGPAAAWIEGAAAERLRPADPHSSAEPAAVAAPAVPCPERAFTVLSFGQSNAANSVQPPFRRSLRSAEIPGAAPGPGSSPRLLLFDWRSGRCHPYREPLAGADGRGGHSLTPAFVALARPSADPVLVVPLAVGNSSVRAWADGELARRHRQVLEQLGRRGLSPQLVLWHQGESDARRLDPGAYQGALVRIMDRSEALAPGSRFGLALASRCFDQGPWEPLRQAQRSAVARRPERRFIWSDSDAIAGWLDRHDGCHFSARGARRLSADLLQSLNGIRNLE